MEGQELPMAPRRGDLTYDSYLKVPQLLELQKPVTEPEQHDETLFIMIHQVYELWFKQILHEMSGSLQALKENQLTRYIRTLKRINTIQKVLIHQVDILETMTPYDFNLFREKLNPASGFQSAQFRIVEFKLGAKNPAYLKYYESDDVRLKELENALNEPTVYDHFLAYLSRNGYKIPQDVLNRDTSKIHVSNEELINVFHEVYKNPKDNFEIYNALEAMVDLEQDFKLWRFRHVAMVERMIGTRMGTGGSSGAPYLKTTLRKQFFPEIWEIRNRFGAEY